MSGAAMPQLPPQVMQALMQRASMQQQGAAPMPANGAPGPMGAPPGVAQAAPQQPPMQGGAPQGSPFGPPTTPPNGGPPGSAAQMAARGRFGDSIVAHVAPGEIMVPPEMQTPQLVAMLRRAFAQVGMMPQQFTAGSPTASHNPATGAPEFSLFSALLPLLGGIAGSFIPGIGTAAGAALGGGAGGALGGAIDHQTPAGIALQALGGAAGGYLGGGLPDPASGVSSSVDQALAKASADTGESWLSAGGAAAGNAGTPSLLSGLPLKTGMTAGLGSTVGSLLAPQPQQSASPPGFNSHMPPLNKNWGQLNGSGSQPTPTFQGYNPYAAATGSPFTFYPQG